MLNDRDRNYLDSTQTFQELPREERDIFLDSAFCLSYPKHAQIHEQGDLVEGYDTVLDGWVRLYRTTPSGKLASPVMLNSGDTYGQSLIILGYKHHFYNASTVKPARIARIPAEIFERRARANPHILFSVNRALFGRMISSLHKAEQRALMSVDQRLACHLLFLTAERAGKGARFPLPYDKYEIAHHLGLSPESFSRAQRRLEAEGLHVRGSEITIESFARLAAFCRPDCAAGMEECRCAQRLPEADQE
jgi:CRP-like cAMP-binding protein